MKKISFVFIFALSVIVLSGCKSSPFAQYDNAATVLKLELKRTSQSWDGAPLPDYLKGKPELVVMRYIFPVGSKLPWHHHPVINYGILHQGFSCFRQSTFRQTYGPLYSVCSTPNGCLSVVLCRRQSLCLSIYLYCRPIYILSFSSSR